MKRLAAGLIALTLVGLLGGCTTQSAGEASTEPTVSTKPTTQATAQPETSEASYLDTVDEIVMCYLPNEASDELSEYRGMLQKDMSAALGIKVTEVNAADYNAAVEAMRTGNADIVFYGPVSYCQAVERSGAEALVIVAPDGDKSKAGYTSKIIVKADSDIKTLEDLEGKTFAFVDPASTSGNYVPRLS